VSTITVNGKRVPAASITLPFYGAWSAELSIDTPSSIGEPGAAAELVVGDLTLHGTIVRGGVFAGDQGARIVGGAGGWRKSIAPKGYTQAAGVRLSLVLEDAARAVGESVVVATERTLGTSWARRAGKAERMLTRLTGGAWWVDAAGKTQTAARATEAITTPFTVIKRSNSQGRIEVATESIASWQPGRTFTSPALTGTQTISAVSIVAEGSGKLRVSVLTKDTQAERLRGDLLELVRTEVAAVSYAATYEYSISASIGLGITATIDATPTDATMPALTKVPLFGIGIVSPPLAGTKCRIRFANGDPSRPECVGLAGTTEHLVTTEACALLIYNTLVTLMAAAGGGPLLAVVLQPLLGTAITAALAAQAVPAPPGLIAQVAAAAALQAGFATGVAPSNAIFAGWQASLGALATKSLDVSGSFPSVGVPNGP
jgi:hypothetical protein